MKSMHGLGPENSVKVDTRSQGEMEPCPADSHEIFLIRFIQLAGDNDRVDGHEMKIQIDGGSCSAERDDHAQVWDAASCPQQNLHNMKFMCFRCPAGLSTRVIVRCWMWQACIAPLQAQRSGHVTPSVTADRTDISYHRCAACSMCAAGSWSVG